MSRYPENRSKKCNTSMMSFRIPNQLKAQIESECAKRDCSQRELVEEALRLMFSTCAA